MKNTTSLSAMQELAEASTTSSSENNCMVHTSSSRKRCASSLWLEQQRFAHGLCTLCGSQIFTVANDSNKRARRLEPLTIPGVVANGRCLSCYPVAVRSLPRQLGGDVTLLKFPSSTVEALAHPLPPFPEAVIDNQGDTDCSSVPSETEIAPVTACSSPSNVTHTIYDAHGLEYVGMIHEGTRAGGKGQFCHSSPTTMGGRMITYEGQFHGTYLDGRGTSHDFGTGCVYTGDFRRGAAHGKGRCVWEQEGWEYNGEWKMDKRHGRGKCWQIQRGGEVYDGEWVRDKWDGKGVLNISGGGGKYRGSFSKNKLHGEGVYEFPDGSVYKGSFFNDSRHGKGEMNYANGMRYVGEWRDNWRFGSGVLYHCDGTYFKGGFVQDKKDGRGYLFFPDGIARKETWYQGMLQS